MFMTLVPVLQFSDPHCISLIVNSGALNTELVWYYNGLKEVGRLTIGKPNFKKFGIQIFTILKWSVFRFPLHTVSLYSATI